MEFCYFRGPASDMSGFLPGARICSLCGQQRPCFLLDKANASHLSNTERRGKVGCDDCLRQDRFGFFHDTEVGFIDENGLQSLTDLDDEPQRVFLVSAEGEAVSNPVPVTAHIEPHVSNDAVVELRRTPDIITWQDFDWPVHCDDFMAYIGTWGPEDFAAAAPQGDGRALFLDLTDPLEHHFWPDNHESKFDKNFIAFQCLHCAKRVVIGNFD